jgi:DNA-binding transcriptional regulator YiaG
MDRHSDLVQVTVKLVPTRRRVVNAFLQPKEAMAITPEQCRAARAMLNWSQPDLAKAANVGQSTITRFECNARTPRASNLAAIQAALEAAGVVFTPGTATTSPGLCLRDPEKK